jgi:tetratricopeptide (TPR) repeat protein
MARPRRAVACCQKAICLHRETGNRLGEVEGWDSLGYAYHQLGDHRQAIECYEHAISGHRELASGHEEAGCRTRLGDVYFFSGHPERARRSWERALAVFEEEHHPNAGRVRRRLQYLRGEVEGPFFEPVN